MNIILRLLLCFTLAVCWCSTAIAAISSEEDGSDSLTVSTTHAARTLPLRYNVMLGAGLGLPDVRGNKHDFFAKNGTHLGYALNGGVRAFLRNVPEVGFGVQYDYVNASRHHDKAHMHFVRPEFVVRVMNDRQTAALFFCVGAGLFNYGERVYYPNEQPMVGETPVSTFPGHRFTKNYLGASLSIGGEAAIRHHLAFFMRFDVLTADWFVNPDARLVDLDDDPYDDAEHHIFRNNVRFFNLSIGLEFGK